MAQTPTPKKQNPGCVVAWAMLLVPIALLLYTAL
jgi:hypothetical protein